MAEGGLQVLDQGGHLGLGLGGEVALDVNLADCLAHHAVGDGEGAFPAWTGLLYARHGLLHGEFGGKEVVAEETCGRGKISGREIVADSLDRIVGHDVVDGGQRLGLTDDEAVDAGEAFGGEVAGEIDGGIFFFKFGQRHGVVGCGRVAEFLARHCCTGQGVLDVHHVAYDAVGCGVVEAGQRGQGVDVFAIGLAEVAG